MPASIENYISQSAVGKQRRQAMFIWSGFTLLAAFWVFLTVIAPIARTNDLTSVSEPIYKICSYICHQIPARSYFVGNQPFAVCSRCLGIYAGLFGGFILYPFFRSIEATKPLSYLWLFLAMIPMALDWSLGYFEIWKNTHFSRLLTGLILGAACAVFIVPALIEIFRMSGSRKQVKRLSS